MIDNTHQEEAVFGRLPILHHEREYSFKGISATGFAQAIATWCFLIGGYSAYYVGAVQGIITLIAGCVIGVTLSALSCALACNRYGLEQIDYTKSCFGQRGSQIIMFFYVINQVGWTGLILVMFANAFKNAALTLGFNAGPYIVSIVTLLGILAAYAITVRGVHMLNVFNMIVTPGLVIVCCALFYFIFKEHGWSALVSAMPLTPTEDKQFNYILSFEYGLGAGFSWWPGIGFLARNTDNQRNSFYPQVLTMGFGMGVICLTGLFSALLFKTYDPTEWMLKIGGPVIGIAALLLVAIANISASSAMIYIAGLSLRHIPFLRSIQWWKLLAVSCLPVMAFVFWPDYLYEKGNAFLAYNATMYAPMSGVLLMDYLLLRKGKLNISQIFESSKSGHYWFFGGFNIFALGCMIAGQIIYLLLLNPLDPTAFVPGHGMFKWFTASVPAILIPMVAYFILAKLFLLPSSCGGYRTQTAPIPIQSPNI